MDDDFLFNEKTKIEVLVDVLEKTELDVVRGSCWFYLLCVTSQGGREGEGQRGKCSGEVGVGGSAGGDEEPLGLRPSHGSQMWKFCFCRHSYFSLSKLHQPPSPNAPLFRL